RFLHAAIRKIDRFAQKSVDGCGRAFALASAFADRYPVQVVAGEKQTRHGGDGGSYPRHALAVAEHVLWKRAPMSSDGQRTRPPPSPEGLAKLATDEGHEVVVRKGGGVRVAHAAQKCRERRLIRRSAVRKDRGVPQAAERAEPLARGDEKANSVERT